MGEKDTMRLSVLRRMDRKEEILQERKVLTIKTGEESSKPIATGYPRYLGIIISDPSVPILIVLETKGHRITTTEQQKGLNLPEKTQEDRIFKKSCKN